MLHLHIISNVLMDLVRCMSEIVYGFSSKCYCRNCIFINTLLCDTDSANFFLRVVPIIQECCNCCI